MYVTVSLPQAEHRMRVTESLICGKPSEPSLDSAAAQERLLHLTFEVISMSSVVWLVWSV